MSVGSESLAAESFANPKKEILVENFRFTKTEDILFALEVDGENVYDLLYKSIYERPYAKVNDSTAILEVVAKVIIRLYTLIIEETQWRRFCALWERLIF